MDNNYITKSDLLIDKLEGTVDLVQTKNRRLEAEKEALIDKQENLKTQNINLTSENEKLKQTKSESDLQHQKEITETKEQIENLNAECDELHKLVYDLREFIVKDPSVLNYYGNKADAIFDVTFSEGKTVMELQDLKEREFPLPLLIEVEEEDFGIQTNNFKLIRSNDKYKLSKLNTNGERAQA